MAPRRPIWTGGRLSSKWAANNHPNGDRAAGPFFRKTGFRRRHAASMEVERVFLGAGVAVPPIVQQVNW